jgi:hypothetical protein
MMGPMKSWLILFALVAGCNVEGTRARCAAGGALTSCPDYPRTAEAACWKLVDCAVIPLDRTPPNQFDWAICVDGIQSQTADVESLIVSCIAASSCDALKVQGSPDDPQVGNIHCLRIGGR